MEPLRVGQWEIRKATIADLPATEAVRVATWKAAYRGIVPATYLDALAVTEARMAWLTERHGDGTLTLIAFDDDEVIGMSVSGPCRDDDRFGLTELYALYVLPARWGSGAGQALLDASGDVTSLWVLADNMRARAFYARNGFLPDGRELQIEFDQPVTEVRCVRALA